MMPKLADIVPMPHGRRECPDLRGSYNHNTDATPEYWWICCPNCGLDHCCVLDPVLNELASGVWFCISCKEMWQYEREY